MARDRTPLAADELRRFLEQHPSWREERGVLVREFEFASFMEAIAFVNRVARIAEWYDHHPDIDIRYRRVVLRLTTHDAGGLTFRDPVVAEECEWASSAFKPP
ncbi:MAG TPA: 4a-hydroxytetrahydrobiopterin dehydratase [Myxococcaceae bacterium]|nr:4a-hydroxytetrahydrobiopterin dehydratase [Myxococcaceae bacterium]